MGAPAHTIRQCMRELLPPEGGFFGFEYAGDIDEEWKLVKKVSLGWWVGAWRLLVLVVGHRWWRCLQAELAIACDCPARRPTSSASWRHTRIRAATLSSSER